MKQKVSDKKPGTDQLGLSPSTPSIVADPKGLDCESRNWDCAADMEMREGELELLLTFAGDLETRSGRAKRELF